MSGKAAKAAADVVSKGPKTLAATVRLLITAASAKPAPPVGPALGQAGLNIMAFCKEFNAKTAGYKEGIPLRVKLKVYSDKSYEWSLLTPPTSWLVKQATGLVRAADKPGHEVAAAISLKHVYEIAKVKQRDTPNLSLEAVAKSVLGACKSMGVRVVPRPEDA
jgi:large subunit ribosomal protein L11